MNKLKIPFLCLLCLLLAVPAQAGWLDGVVKTFSKKPPVRTFPLQMTKRGFVSTQIAKKGLTLAIEKALSGETARQFKALGSQGEQVYRLLLKEKKRQGVKYLSQEEALANQELHVRYVKRLHNAMGMFKKWTHTPEATASLSKKITTISSSKPNYVPLIGENARFIYLGEVHWWPAIQEEIEAVISQYKAAFPQKKVYLMSEFIASDMPLVKKYSPKLEEILKENSILSDNQRKIFVKLSKQGIILGGLERPGLIHDRYPTTRGYMHSRYCTLVKAVLRNLEFAKRLEKIKQQAPDAVIFVYGGKAHFNYLVPNNVPNLVSMKDHSVSLKETMVIEFGFKQDRLSWSAQAMWHFWAQKNPLALGGADDYLIQKMEETVLSQFFGSDIQVSLPEERAFE